MLTSFYDVLFVFFSSDGKPVTLTEDNILSGFKPLSEHKQLWKIVSEENKVRKWLIVSAGLVLSPLMFLASLHHSF